MTIQHLAPNWRNIQPTWLLTGILFGTKINLVGEIYIGELIAVSAFPLYVFKKKASKETLPILALAIFWSFAQAISDILTGR